MNTKLILVTQVIALVHHTHSILIPECSTLPISPLCTYDPSTVTNHLPICSVSVDQFVNGRLTPGNSPRPNGVLPPWLNYKLALRGQQVMQEYAFPIGMSILFGVLIELNMPDVRNVLMFTNHSATPTYNAMRDLSTAAQGMVWAFDPFQENGLLPSSQNFIKSIENVRQRHINATARANLKIQRDGYLTDSAAWINTPTNDVLWTAFANDLSNSDIPAGMRAPPPSHWTNISALIFNQQAMAMVQYNLLAYPILFGEQLAFNACDQDFSALNHLFAVVGYALGMDNEYNPALKPDIASVRMGYREIFDNYIIPGLFQFDKQTHVMLDNVLGGLNQISDGLFSPPVILYRFLKHFVSIDAPQVYAQMSQKDKDFDAALDLSLISQFMSDPVYREGVNTVFLEALNTAGALYYPGLAYSTIYTKARYAFSPDPQ